MNNGDNVWELGNRVGQVGKIIGNWGYGWEKIGENVGNWGFESEKCRKALTTGLLSGGKWWKMWSHGA